MEVYLSSGLWQTRLYYKPIDLHAYLSPASCHPRGIIKKIIKGVLVRIRRACSEDSEFEKVWRLYIEVFFSRRGYPLNVAWQQYHAIASRRDLLEKGPKDDTLHPDRVPFYFPFSQHSQHVLRGLAISADGFAAATPAEQAPFTLPQALVHKAMKNLKKHLVRASITPMLPVRTGCFACHTSTCLLDLVLAEGKEVYSDTYDSNVKIPTRVTCDDRHIIYAVRCKRCKVQGVGECAIPRQRLMSYIVAARDHAMPGGVKECAIHTHFLLPGHEINDLEIVLVDKIPATLKVKRACIPALRIRGENRWQRKLGVVLNIRSRLHHSFPGVYNAKPVRPRA